MSTDKVPLAGEVNNKEQIMEGRNRPSGGPLPTRIDKGTWSLGPWIEEPDYEDFVDEEAGYICVISRHPRMGTLRGFVGVQKSHSLWGQDYRDGGYRLFTVHGGVTFTGEIGGMLGCHLLNAGWWWIGFDCGHSGTDLMPARIELNLPGVVYRDIAYVRAQCIQLASQLKALETK
jgi:hypothetical protein